MILNKEKKESLLQAIKEVLPGAEWAPKEAWVEEGQNAKKDSETVHFFPFCDCVPHDLRPAHITLFLKAALSGQHFNVVGKVERVVREWVKREMKVEGCGMCEDGVEVDLRLFRTDEDKRLVVEEEVDFEVSVG